MLTYKRLIYAFTAFLLTLVLSSCFQLFDAGKNTIIKSASNDSKNKKAVLFLKSGNATTGESLQVSILNYNQDLNETENGNVLITGSDHGNLTLDTGAVELIWLSKDSLLIKYNRSLRTFTKLSGANDIKIRYLEED
ncbi:hypothetical protein GZH53_06005 [Flavihumibacter sp. R14]|nr:hypothetical protein [Flavihumibacter soli]